MIFLSRSRQCDPGGLWGSWRPSIRWVSTIALHAVVIEADWIREAWE